MKKVSGGILLIIMTLLLSTFVMEAFSLIWFEDRLIDRQTTYGAWGEWSDFGYSKAPLCIFWTSARFRSRTVSVIEKYQRFMFDFFPPRFIFSWPVGDPFIVIRNFVDRQWQYDFSFRDPSESSQGFTPSYPNDGMLCDIWMNMSNVAEYAVFFDDQLITIHHGLIMDFSLVPLGTHTVKLWVLFNNGTSNTYQDSILVNKYLDLSITAYAHNIPLGGVAWYDINVTNNAIEDNQVTLVPSGIPSEWVASINSTLELKGRTWTVVRMYIAENKTVPETAYVSVLGTTLDDHTDSVVTMTTASGTRDIVVQLERELDSLATDLDIYGPPLDSDWISKLAGNPNFTLVDYVDMGIAEISMNSQMWPTGDSGSKFYSASRPESVKAVEFRKAVACLTDRDAIVRDVLKGYGFRMDLPMPPFQSAYMDMYNYTQSSLICNYNKTRAEEILDAAGFTINPATGIRRDPIRGGDLQPLIFYIRQDDPNRRKAGEMLVAELRAEGIPVNAIIAERTICYKNVMGLYNYNLYTGGSSLSTIPDQYYDLYSSMTYYGPSIGWSQNYPGFCNAEFDSWALKVKYPDTVADAQAAAKSAGYLFLKYCASIPLYCMKAVKAYRTGWTGVVNNAGFGIDNYWTFLNMKKTGDTQIDWGFNNDIEQLNIVSSEWPWDQKVLSLIYESLVGSNPFSLEPSEWFLGESGYVGTWDASGVGGTNPATFINFTLRNNVYWHNASCQPRRLFTAYDVEFSFEYQYACGPGIARNYPSLASYDHCEVYDNTHVAIFYKKKSAWTFQWAGSLPIINPDVWSFVGPGPATKTYDPANQDLNGNGINDIFEDGTGAWMYNSHSIGDYLLLDFDPCYYLSSSFISDRLAAMFHNGAGDVNGDSVVNILDLSYMARSLGETSASPHGTGWGQYNTDCDLDLSGFVDLKDLTSATINYGKNMG